MAYQKRNFKKDQLLTADDLNKMDDQIALNEQLAKEANDSVLDKLDKSNVVQEPGDAEDKVMSQKATTEQLGQLSEAIVKVSSISEILRDEFENIRFSHSALDFVDSSYRISSRRICYAETDIFLKADSGYEIAVNFFSENDVNKSIGLAGRTTKIRIVRGQYFIVSIAKEGGMDGILPAEKFALQEDVRSNAEYAGRHASDYIVNNKNNMLNLPDGHAYVSEGGGQTAFVQIINNRVLVSKESNHDGLRIKITNDYDVRYGNVFTEWNAEIADEYVIGKAYCVYNSVYPYIGDGVTVTMRDCNGATVVSQLRNPVNLDTAVSHIHIYIPPDFTCYNAEFNIIVENSAEVKAEKELSGVYIPDNSNLYNGKNITRGHTVNEIGALFVAENYMVSDFIRVIPGEMLKTEEYQNHTLNAGGLTTHRICGYNSNKEFTAVLCDEKRMSVGHYERTFEIPENCVYIRLSNRITDTDIKVSKIDKKNEGLPQTLVYADASYTQGLCVSDKYLFVSSSPSQNADPDDYVVKKVDLLTGATVATSARTFNHANGMCYNENTNKIYICGLEGKATTETTISDMDYSLYVVNADTLEFETTVILKDIILSVCAESVGISGVGYNELYDEYYLLTRYPERHIITLGGDLTLKNSFYMYKTSELGGVTGDICTDGYKIYVPTWRSDLNQLYNEVRVYSRGGVYLGTYNVNGYTHIESMDIRGGDYYFNFIDFNDTAYNAKTIKTKGIHNLK